MYHVVPPKSGKFYWDKIEQVLSQSIYGRLLLFKSGPSLSHIHINTLYHKYSWSTKHYLNEKSTYSISITRITSPATARVASTQQETIQSHYPSQMVTSNNLPPASEEVDGTFKDVYSNICEAVFKLIFDNVFNSAFEGVFERAFSGAFKSIFESVFKSAFEALFERVFERVLKSILKSALKSLESTKNLSKRGQAPQKKIKME